MSHAIDFGELKQRVSIERVAEMLGAKLTKSGARLRGPCPLCKAGGDRAFVVTPAKRLYYCFGACGKGGDVRRASAESAVFPHGDQIFRSREAVKLIFNTTNREDIDCNRKSALRERLGTTFWLIDGLGSGVGELSHGGRQGDAGGA